MLLPRLRSTTFNAVTELLPGISVSFPPPRHGAKFEKKLSSMATKSHAGGQWLYLRSVEHLGIGSDGKDCKDI